MDAERGSCVSGNLAGKDSNGIWLTSKDGDQSLMYVDPNTIVEIIKELCGLLLYMANLAVCKQAGDQ